MGNKDKGCKDEIFPIHNKVSVTKINWICCCSEAFTVWEKLESKINNKIPLWKMVSVF